MSTKAQQVLTVDDVRAIAAALPAEYEKRRQADQREMQRVYEFHSLTAEAPVWRQLGFDCARGVGTGDADQWSAAAPGEAHGI